MDTRTTQTPAMSLTKGSDAERLYRAGDAQGAAAILERHLTADAALPRHAWAIYFASVAKLGRPVELGHFRAARDESLLPFLYADAHTLLNRSAADQVALLADIIPSLTDLTTLHLATDLWCARVPALDRTEALAAVDKAQEWLSHDDCSRVLTTLEASACATGPADSVNGQRLECANPPGTLTTRSGDGNSDERCTVAPPNAASHLPKWLAPLSAWANIIHRRTAALSLPQTTLIVVAILLIVLRRLSAFVPQLLQLRTILERLIQIV